MTVFTLTMFEEQIRLYTLTFRGRLLNDFTLKSPLKVGNYLTLTSIRGNLNGTIFCLQFAEMALVCTHTYTQTKRERNRIGNPPDDNIVFDKHRIILTSHFPSRIVSSPTLKCVTYARGSDLLSMLQYAYCFC